MPDGAPLRLLFFGTPEFAVPSLRALAASRHQVVGLVSQPDRRRGRGRKLAPTPTRAEADARGIPVFQPERVGDPEALEWMRALEPDLGIVVAFGQFIPKSVRMLPPHGLVNAHASLLPRHRGAAPIPYAILEGDARSGVSIMRVVREMDAGDVCALRETAIGSDETAGELEARLSKLAADGLLEAVDAIAARRARFVPQDPAGVTLAPKLERDFGRLDLRRPRAEVLRRIRAATPRPGADLFLRRLELRLRVLRARTCDDGPPEPGRVQARDGRLVVSALDGWLEVLRLQVPGRRPVDAPEYLRGSKLPADEEVENP
jgi:methionyl-tRNA formyltransferase